MIAVLQCGNGCRLSDIVDVEWLAHTVYEELLKRSLIVRPVGNYGLPNHLRISIGLPDQNKRLISAMEELLG